MVDCSTTLLTSATTVLLYCSRCVAAQLLTQHIFFESHSVASPRFNTGTHWLVGWITTAQEAMSVRSMMACDTLIAATWHTAFYGAGSLSNAFLITRRCCIFQHLRRSSSALEKAERLFGLQSLCLAHSSEVFFYFQAAEDKISLPKKEKEYDKTKRTLIC